MEKDTNKTVAEAFELMKAGGPECLQKSFEEFQRHTETLLQRIDDLFDADPLLSLMGVHYEFKMYCDAIHPGDIVLDKEYGAGFTNDMMSSYKEFLNSVQN